MKLRVVRAHRSRTLPEHGGETLFFKLDIGRLGKFINPADMPPFEGDDGFVEVEGPNTRLKGRSPGLNARLGALPPWRYLAAR